MPEREMTWQHSNFPMTPLRAAKSCWTPLTPLSTLASACCFMGLRNLSGSEEEVVLFGHADDPGDTGMWSSVMG
jgi:hypothetical protein